MLPINPGRTGSIRLPHTVNLASGSVVSVRVSEHLSDGRLRIALNGRMLTADFSSTGSRPEVGQTARALVQGTDQQGRIVIELLASRDSALLRRLDLPDDPSHRTTIAAFARSGLPLDPATISDTARRVQNQGADAAFFARIVALLKRKGLPESLAERIAWPGATHETAEGGRHGPVGDYSDSSDDSGRDGHQQGSHHGRDSQRQHEKLAEDLRRSIERPAESAHPIHLFNHRTEGESGWAIIPLAVKPFDTVTLALQRNRHGTIIRAALRIAFDSVRVQAVWPAGGGTVNMSTNSADMAERMEKLLSSLSLVLESYGLRVDTVNITDNIDGFSDESLGNILQTIDTDV